MRVVVVRLAVGIVQAARCSRWCVGLLLRMRRVAVIVVLLSASVRAACVKLRAQRITHTSDMAG